MTTVERLARWRDAGAITPEQHDALVAIVRKDRFSLFLELNALLYLGVLSLVGGIAWTVHTYSERLGDTVVLMTLGLLLVACLAYCWSRARPFSTGEVESPTLLFDYVLYLGCLTFSVALAYVEVRFALLRDAWDTWLLVSSMCFFAAAYRFDNRFVLSLALSTLAGWFGIRVRWWGTLDAGSVRASALAYGALVTAAGLLFWTRGLKRHFLAPYLHVAANVTFAALLSGVADSSARALFLALLLALGIVTGVLGVRYRRFAFVVYAVVYAYIGVSIEVLRGVHDLTATLIYLVVSGAVVVVAIVMLARAVGRAE